MNSRSFAAFLLAISACLSSQVQAQEPVSSAEQIEPIIYEGRGVKVTAPAGWIVYKGMRRRPEILALFSRLPYESKGSDNPRIVLIEERRRKKGPADVMARARRAAEVLDLMKNVRTVERVEVLEQPSECGSSCSRIVYEITRREKDRVETVRSAEYAFLSNGRFFVLLCGADPAAFDTYRDDFERTARSVSFGQ